MDSRLIEGDGDP